ncbi:hypothetical protein, conserved [Trypanosoma brucei gambiense DAL972]|uniref:Phosphatidylinositol-4-phosphate 5-kinase n=1 Tax=Trypanosoma brucei gambiense (strain MHOM/CI/86/DAL972) TaxID=679716 RepID=D0A7P2_TRYB9|nr:hypothetical protein, conserved [Trypanosoma brucei gambiense DAL972]CBH17693.1 hypothetical protein, conserved [Trypanosoma brucei gambiense DAL972]|eukprot:XP_011779957.1 hypothetical protein, conserved [Trypanosoma brucei gambiense DAL972]
MTTKEAVVQIYRYLKAVCTDHVSSNTVPTTAVRKYVGEVDDDNLFHGHGALVSAMGFIYEGTFVHGCMEGHGRISWANGVSYEGSFHNNAPHGIGVLTKANGDRYAGEVYKGVYHGYGESTTATGVYNGQWRYGKRHGKGRQTYANGGSYYEGEWAENMRHGSGKLLYPNGDLYDGMWVNGKRHGHGSMGWKSGTAYYVEVYEGEWYEGVPQGFGRSTYVHYIDPSRATPDTEGPATFAHPSCAVINVYEGEFANGKRNGFGIFYYADGSTYEGTWRDGNKFGRGKCITNAGSSYYGTFDCNEMDLPPGDMSSDPLPSVTLTDLVNVSDGSTEHAASSIRLLVLRFNNPLKDIFTDYCGKQRGIKFVTTHTEWWRHRLPGHLCIPQFLRLLNDARIINGYITIGVAVDCVVTTLEEEEKKDHSEPVDQRSGRLRKLRSEVLRLDGCINYRQFVESLVRLSAKTCIGPNFAELSRQFTTIVERLLDKKHIAEEPLCPVTREYEAILTKDIVHRLEHLYFQLAEDAVPDLRGTAAVLTAHNFILFFHDKLDSCNIGLVEAVNVVLPFDRFKIPGTVPSGMCQPRNAMGHSLYEKSSGPGGEFLATLVASERRLTFVEFVEAVLVTMRLAGALKPDEMCGKLLELVGTEESSHDGV